MSQRILITGGAGFIGSHLAESFCRRGDAVVILDNFSSGSRENLAAIENRVEVIEGSVTDRDTLHQVCRGVETVLHLAAIPSVPGSIEDPVGTAHVNLFGTVLLLDEARRAGVSRLVFASSSAVYGETARVPTPEEAPTVPLSPYGAHKLASEYFCRIATATGGPDCVSFRFFNVYGPRQSGDSDYAAAIPIFRFRCRSGERPTIFGDGTQTRDFIHVTDLVEAVQRSVDRKEPWRGAALNLARGEAVSIGELARRIMKTEGVDGEPSYTEPRTGDILHSSADITRLRKALDWSPRIELEEGLEALD